jgi:hypothetical protein
MTEPLTRDDIGTAANFLKRHSKGGRRLNHPVGRPPVPKRW